MSKFYFVRHKRYDMYWGRKHNRDMWINDLQVAILLTEEQWKEIFSKDNKFKNDVILYERRYDV